MTPEQALARVERGGRQAEDWGVVGPVGNGGGAAPAAPFKRMHRLLRGRYGVAMTLAVVGAVGGCVLGYLSQRPKYRATGWVEIQPIIRRPTSDDRMMLMYQQYVQNQVALLQSPRVLGAAMTSREWSDTKEGNSPEMQARFTDVLDVQVLPGTTLIKVAYLDADKEVAGAAVSAVIHAYEQVYGDVNANETKRAMDILENQRTAQTNAIRAKRERIQQYAQRFGTTDLQSYQSEKLRLLAGFEQQLTQAQYQLENVESAVARARRGGSAAATQPVKAAAAGGPVAGSATAAAVPGLAGFEAAAAVAPPVASSAPSASSAAVATMSENEIAAVDPTLRELMKVRREAQARVQQLQGVWGAANRNVQDATRQATQAQRDVDDYVGDFRQRYVAIIVDPITNTPTPISRETVDQYRNKVALSKKLYEAEQQDTKAIGETLTAIQKEEDDLKNLQEQLNDTERSIQVKSAETLMSGTLLVHSYGEVPATAAVDRRKPVAVLGLMGGGALPLGLMILLGIVDSRHRYSDEVASDLAGIPLLGILPDLPDLMSDPEQASVAAHCVHQIRTMLQLSSESQNRRVFAMTSPSPGDGKTSLTLALGLSFAATGSKTLLIDCDLVGAGLTARMNVGRPEGVLEAIASRTILQHVQHTDVENLSILPVGTGRAAAGSMLTPAAVTRLVNEARNQYDVILIDTGPILGSIEASPVSVAADGVVLVVSRGQSRPLVEKSLTHLVAIGARLAGVVFNRANHADFEKSMSRMSMQRLPSPYPKRGEHPDSSVTQAGGIGPVARAMRQDEARV